MAESRTYTFRDGVHHYAFGDALQTALEISALSRGRRGGLWAFVRATAGTDQVINQGRINLDDLRDRERFQRLAISNGTIDWNARLISIVDHVRGLHSPTNPAESPAALPSAAPVLPFPTEVFPDAIAALIREGAQALPCPEDFLGVPMVAVLSAAIGNARAIELMPGWRERTRVFGAVVAEPGSLKSPALDLVLQPVYAHQERLKDAYKEAKKAYEQALLEYERAMGAWKRDKKAGAPSDKPEEPVMQQVFTTDATVEALATVLEHNHFGLLLVRDELTGWVRALNQYKGGKGADRQYWLSFWNGAPILVNRKTRKEPLVVQQPFLCVTGCLPPDVLGELSDEQGREDGFVHRIMFAFPDPKPLAWTGTGVQPATRAAYAAVIEQLWHLPPRRDGEPGPLVRPFTPAGKRAWVEWIGSHFAELNAPALGEELRGPWGKMQGYCARFALMLHECRLVCGDGTPDGVDEASVYGAAALIEYCKSHARRVYGRLHSTPDDTRAVRAVAWLRKQGGTATDRDVLTGKVAGCKKAQEVDALIEDLRARGLVTVRETRPPRGGRASKHITVVSTLQSSEGEG